MSLVEHILRKITDHAQRFDDLPVKTVESAAVTDEQKAAWSDEMYKQGLQDVWPKGLIRGKVADL